MGKEFKNIQDTIYVRLIGVQFKIRDADFVNGFSSHVEEFYRSADPGDMIIFPEDIGLLTAFRGLSASTTAEAMQTIYAANQDKVDSILGNNSIQNFTTAIFLSLTDKFVREFYDLFASLSRRYSVFTIACNNMPRFVKSGGSYDFSSREVNNTAFVFGREGTELFRQDKVFLTQMEIDLGMTGGHISNVSTFAIGDKKFGIAISLDAFVPRYISRLDGADVVIQPDANPGKWNATLPNGRWQPEEWMDSAYYIAQRIDSVRYVVNPMMVGSLWDVVFEGQSSITKKAEDGDTKMGYVGNQPSTGFHSLLGVEGYSPFTFIQRERLKDEVLGFDEGMVEIEL